MSQRVSGYERIENDLYETPAWVTHALRPQLPLWVKSVWEPASGPKHNITKALQERIPNCPVIEEVHSSDKTTGDDFLLVNNPKGSGYDAIITNPPYGMAEDFIRKALELTEPDEGLVAMLLRTDFDHAKTRRDLFADHVAFSKKLVLLQRIKWFEGTEGSPSYNHAWFIWSWRHEGPPTIAYGP